jgi:signal-transduction protein with cAMP-binding, CBS, and nucleotidyltransferase domain
MGLALNIKVDSVSRLRPTPAWNLSTTQSVADAVDLMRAKDVGCILICEQGRVVGIFTERDLMRRVLASGRPLSTPLADCMTPEPVVVDPKDSISVAIRRMIEGGYRHLPVVRNGVPEGILSVKRIVHYLVEHFPATIHNLPPDTLGKACS